MPPPSNWRVGFPPPAAPADLSREKFHNVPFSGGGSHASLEPDKLPDGLYWATVGTLFEYQKL
jgi:hypothetical protein